jgi:Na+-translocating ferredoxin:NAD+ oxidoreductase subunit B
LPVNAAELIAAVDAALPQTQCTRCGYPDCRSYARAIAEGAAINQCPPGGAEGIVRLARITGRPVQPLNAENGEEGPRRLAVIDEAWCIGCTLCLKACPVDCIVGGPKAMHTVIDGLCTGCELCIPVCPVDCISLSDASAGRTGWDAWSAAAAHESRDRYDFHRFRLEREQSEYELRLAAKAQAAIASSNDAVERTEPTDNREADGKRAVIEAALARSRQRKTSQPT